MPTSKIERFHITQGCISRMWKTRKKQNPNEIEGKKLQRSERI
jgi:hypothetical protein